MKNLSNKVFHSVKLECRCIHSGIILQKRRKTPEERKLNSRSIEYPQKSKLPVLQVWRCITPKQLAEILKKDLKYVQQLFLDTSRNPNEPIDDMKLLQQALKRSGHRMEIISNPFIKTEADEDKDVYPRPLPNKSLLKPRPPVVTIMGHVDHGKTTLLDALRHSKVVEKEFGGITQHIGAFSVLLETGARVTFLDTPGHAAFTTMRERGAQITDIVVLVVAADDGVMEQTVESIKMAKSAKVPILVAINKIDSGKADVERTKKMLLEVGIQVEDYGGDVQTVPISALKRTNLDLLIDALVLQAEVLEIKADYTGLVEGVVVESRIDQSRGKLCTVIVKRGTLKKGCILIAGTCHAKVRLMRNEEQEILTSVTPGYPAEIEGWRELPSPGDVVLEVETERKAKDVIRIRHEKLNQLKEEEDKIVIMEKIEEHRKEYTEKLRTKRKMGRFKLKPEGPRQPEYKEDDDNLSLNLLIKADVDGSVEAIVDTLETYDNTNLCELNLINSGVGTITENDLEMAQLFNGVIYAFNIAIPKKIEEQSEQLGIKLKKFNVIYKLIDDVKEELNAKLPPIEVEEICGEATVLQQFEINGRKKIPIAGCRVTKGILKKNGIFKLIRNGEIIHTGKLSSLRHVKNEVDSIKTNMECGLQLVDKSITFQQGDTIQCIEKVSKNQEIDWDPGF